MDVDVLVVGAGIVGLTTAAMLPRDQARAVAVIDAAEIGLGGTTGASTGHVDVVSDAGLTKLIRMHGIDQARVAITALQRSVGQVCELSQHYNVDCDCHTLPALLYADAEDGTGSGSVEEECQAAHNLGIDARLLTSTDTVPFAAMPAVCEFNNVAARVDPVRYLEGLARGVVSSGINIFEHSRLMAYPTCQAGRMVSNVIADGVQRRVIARKVVLATHSSFGSCLSVETRAFPSMSCVIAARLEQPIPDDVLLWDVHSPYHYTRVADSGANRDVVLVGGEDFKFARSDPRQHLANLEMFLQHRFHVREILARWTGELWSTFDGFPFVGATPGSDGNVLLAAGFDGQGLSTGTAAAQLIADLVAGKDGGKLARLWSPARLGTGRAATGMIAGNMSVAKSFVTGLVKGTKVSHNAPTASLAAGGQGKLVRKKAWPLQFRPKAVYREQDVLAPVHVMSSTCTHRGCTVQWNEFDHTWDCPCHGGRFNETGTRIYGPPETDLRAEEW